MNIKIGVHIYIKLELALLSLCDVYSIVVTVESEVFCIYGFDSGSCTILDTILLVWNALAK